ncbi:MAG: hypothetical protein SNJ82_08940 [Gemmataceae bacterium]
MRLPACLALAVCLLLNLEAALIAAPRFAPNVVTDKPRSPADQRKAFTLPPGFEIQLVAAEPDIHKPMNLAFDDRGRLWVREPPAGTPSKSWRISAPMVGHAKSVPLPKA